MSDEDFQYCIAMWNNTNTEGRSVAAADFDPGDPDQSGGSYTDYARIPSLMRTVIPGCNDPATYVQVPQSIILSDTNARLGTEITDGYAGNSGYVRFAAADGEDQDASLPRISVSTAERMYISNVDVTSESFAVEVYDENGEKTFAADQQREGHVILGILDDEASPSVTELLFWLNARVPENLELSSQYSGTMTYHFDIQDENAGTT